MLGWSVQIAKQPDPDGETTMVHVVIAVPAEAIASSPETERLADDDQVAELFRPERYDDLCMWVRQLLVHAQADPPAASINGAPPVDLMAARAARG